MIPLQASWNLLVYGQPGATWSLPCVLATPLSGWRGVTLRDLGLSLSWAQHTGGPRRPAAASQVVTGCDSWECGVCVPGGSRLGVAAGLSVSVLRISVIIAVYAGCVWSCVCLSGCSALQEPLQCVGGRHPGLPSGKIARLILIAQPPHPPPCCHQRLCFHPPSTGGCPVLQGPSTLLLWPPQRPQAPSSPWDFRLPGRCQWLLGGFTWDVLVPGEHPPFAAGTAWAQLPSSSDLRPVPRFSGPQHPHPWVGMVMLVPILGWGCWGWSGARVLACYKGSVSPHAS